MYSLKADIIVIAAPYWDLSFPAQLKDYIERVNAVGVTFDYDQEGIPYGLCRAKKLVYITTAGGNIQESKTQNLIQINDCPLRGVA